MGKIVSKFGGSSLATFESVRQVAQILRSNPDRRFAVVSAPGKRSPDDVKVTDLLGQCVRLRREGKSFQHALDAVFKRFFDLADDDDELRFDIQRWCRGIGDEAERTNESGRFVFGDDWFESRGEYLMGRLLARMIGWKFLDAADLIFFDSRGLCEPLTYDTIATKLTELSQVVIPGYYGKLLSDNSIKVFPRGGSDITGAIIARGVSAYLYENWTDVCGIYAADPRIVEKPVIIRQLTSAEARELCYAGASVLHADALTPVLEAGIPTRVLNTFDPDGPYTDIVSEVRHPPGSVVGLAGRKGFTILTISRSSMNPEIGFTLKLLQILKEFGVSYEHMPGGLDSVSIIIDDAKLGDKLPHIVDAIGKLDDAIEVTIRRQISMITIVGEGMVHARGSAAAVFTALRDADVNIATISQGANEMVIVIGVDNTDYERAILAVYEKCVEHARLEELA